MRLGCLLLLNLTAEIAGESAENEKVFLALISVIMIVSLCSCGYTVQGSNNPEKYTSLIKIKSRSNLYYDSETKIVYFLFNEYAGNCGYGYMYPYYVSNGFPYLYDVETNSLIEIEK